MKATFGEYIRQLRTDKGLTLTQLAAQLDLDSANLSKIENGKRPFDEKRLQKLADALEIDFDTVTMEYYSDLIALKLYQSNCHEDILLLAAQKVKYLRQKNSKQTQFKF
jgi:HTH-type transcriptional regulator, competence development regulator